MKLYYDFHIHTALSPCADEDMTPNNIVNMSLLKGLDAIAVTDHNAFQNAGVLIQCAADTELLVIPGMELETQEEVHLVCLFPNLAALEAFGKQVQNALPNLQNRKEIFGRQLIMDAKDNICSEYDTLLITATALPLEEAVCLCEKFKGVYIPAHIDRSSNSVLSNLGFIPPEINFPFLEVSSRSTPDEMISKNRYLQNYGFITSSDAHNLYSIHEKEYFIEVDDKSIPAIFDYLKNNQ